MENILSLDSPKPRLQITLIASPKREFILIKFFQESKKKKKKIHEMGEVRGKWRIVEGPRCFVCAAPGFKWGGGGIGV